MKRLLFIAQEVQIVEPAPFPHLARHDSRTEPALVI